MSRIASLRETLAESAALAAASLRAQPGRSTLAILGIVIGIVTVMLVSSVLAGVRNQVALLFRDLGTENVFAYHRSGDPYARPTEAEAQRKPLDPDFARTLARGRHVRAVAVQVIVPTVLGGRILSARAGPAQSDTILLEGISPNAFEVIGADLAAGRAFTDLEDRGAARVAILGANVAKALFGAGQSVRRELVVGGTAFSVVGEAAPRKGGFFGENRQDNVISIPLGTAQRLYPEVKATIFYLRARPGEREELRGEVEATLRLLRGLRPGQPNDFMLSTYDQIVANLDQLSAAIGLATVALAGVSLFIGGIGIANVMIIAVTERTREIGVRMAIGARRSEVRRQFLLESAILSLVGGLAGVAAASLLGLLISLALPGLSASPPLWIVLAGIVASVLVGMAAGYWPASRAAALNPVEALRYE